MARILTMLTLTLAALVLTATPTLAGGGLAGGGGGHGLCRGFGDGEQLELDDNCFDAVGHEIEAGTTLTVRNRGQLPHTYTAVDGTFDTGTLEPGETTELVFEEAGTWRVRCTLHSDRSGFGMTGLLVVTDDVPMDLAAASTDDDPGPWIWSVLATCVTMTAATLVVRRLTASRD